MRSIVLVAFRIWPPAEQERAGDKLEAVDRHDGGPALRSPCEGSKAWRDGREAGTRPKKRTLSDLQINLCCLLQTSGRLDLRLS
ncbi:hypothetical protein PHSY_002325 [Pseudozyma hubeiensis SY62]|uniref:Uncharacterized protein n=1 Tax=Pseudozyma hubeiensis (strain SY62) TaxID=1305764 RepID=R9P0Y4_PSEHS|nr:hypothetical protein PHSY_002325 [Pseudozyma hubeiensis SY62]GAC94752.1 hypothetical protein PHSY_002325 [Pseudozyma hubeiensis SY62]